MRSVLAFLVLCFPVLAQSDAVCLVNRIDGSLGSCVVVERSGKLDDGWNGLAITAYHVMFKVGTASNAPVGPVEVTYKNGRKCSGCNVVSFNRAADLAVIRVWIPDDVEPARIALAPSLTKDVVILGYPGGVAGENGGGRFLRSHEGCIYCDIEVRQGYSGGGIFQGGEMIGCITGGWFWANEGQPDQYTWPTYGGSSDSIRKLLREAREKLTPNVTPPKT